MNFRIEQMTAEHLEPCIAVFVAAFTKPGRYVWKQEDVRVRLTDLWNEPRRVGLVAIEGPEFGISGFAIGNFVQVSDGPALRIGELCVLPARRGYGLGSRLLVGMEELAREGGAHSAYLSVQPTSVDFCQRLGYQRQEEWVSMGRRLHDEATDHTNKENGHGE